MNKEMIREYWKYTISQSAEKMRTFFHEEAVIRWHNTNEKFTVDEYIKVNCAYPDTWYGEVQRIEELGNIFITVTKVYNDKLSCHAVSFIEFQDDKIIAIDEYWGDDGDIPEWRKEMNVGGKIVKE